MSALTPHLSTTVRRLIAGGGFALAIVAGPTVASLAAPHTPSPSAQAACDSGEEEDTFTTNCTPFLVPNSPSPFSSIPGNPDIPAVDGVPCTGRDSGSCIGLAEEEQSEGPQAVPRSSFSSSP